MTKKAGTVNLNIVFFFVVVFLYYINPLYTVKIDAPHNIIKMP